METSNSEITALPGCYLLVILGEPLCENHKEKILQRVAKGLLSWNTEETQCDLKHLEQVCDNLKTSQKSSAKTELLLQHSTDKLAVEVLFNPQIFTLKQCLRNLLLSPTGHKHVIHAGYSFTGSGSWILQDGIFRFHDFVDELSDPGVTKVLSLYPPGFSLKMHLHCSPTGDWVTNNLENQAFSHFMHLTLNPPDSPNGVPGASSLLEFIEGSLETLEGEEKLEPSPLIGNIRFERPTMYIFPSGQGDCSLFGVTGFTMLIDGGFTRFPCFWKFVRHIERLDSIMITRINESNLWGILSLLRGKQESSLYLKIGYVFCNIVDKSINSSEEGVNGENGGVASIQSNPNDLTISIIEVGNEIASRLKRIGCNPHQCLRDPIPTQLTLYHKVGHGTLEMFILSPPRDSRLLKDFLSHWSSNKDSLPVVRTRSACKNGGQSGQDIAIPISDVMSICCLLIWKPSNPNDRITRILFPGSAPQSQIMEGLASLKELDLLQKRVCTGSSLKQSKSKSTVKSSVRISETSSSTTAQKVSTRYRSVSPSMRKTRIAYTKQSSTELGDKGGDSSESQSSPVRRKLMPTSNQQTEASRITRVSTRESVKKTTGEEKKSVKNVTEKKTKTRTSSTTRSTTTKATSKSTSEPTSEASETVKARPITSKQVRARVNSRRVSDKTTSETDNEAKKEIQSNTKKAENGDLDFSDKKRETTEVCSEDDHRDSGKGSEDASPKKLPFLDHLRDEVEPDSLESYEIYGNVEISKDSLEHSEDEVVTGDSRSTSQLDHLISREDDDEEMKSRSSPIQEDSNLQSNMISSLSSNLSEMTVISGDKNDDSASDLEVASLTSRINNQMSRSIEISHVEGSRRKSSGSNGSFRTLEAEIKAACEEEDRQSIGSSSRKSSILSEIRRDSIVKENIFASETSYENKEIENSSISEHKRISITSGDDDYRRASISEEKVKSERKLSKSSEQEIEVSKVETVPNKELEFESSKTDSTSLEFKEESIESFSKKLSQNEMQISNEKKKDGSGSLENELSNVSIEEGKSLRKDSIRLSADKTVEEKKIEETTITSEIETSGQNDIESIVPESKDNANEAEVTSKEMDIDTKEVLSTEKEKLFIDSSKSLDASSGLSQSQSETSLESTKQIADDKDKIIIQSADKSAAHDTDTSEKKDSAGDSQQSVTESISKTEQQEEESKAQSKVCDEDTVAFKMDQEDSNLKDEIVSSTEISSQSKVTTSIDSERKFSSEISSSLQIENKGFDDQLNINDGDDTKQDSLTSKKDFIKTSETSKSIEPDSDGTKPESRKSSMTSGETKQQATSDKISETKEADLKRESVSDVFESQVDRKTSVTLDSDSRKQSLSSDAMDSTNLQSIQIGRTESLKSESATHEDPLISSQAERKDSIQSDSGRSKTGSTADDQFENITETKSDTKKSDITSASSQITRKDSIQSEKERSSISSDSRRMTETEIQYGTTTTTENDFFDKENSHNDFDETTETESSAGQIDRKESFGLKDVTSESIIHEDTSIFQIVRKDSVQSSPSQIERRESVQAKDGTSDVIDSMTSSQTSRKDSIKSDSNINTTSDSGRSTLTEIQYKTIPSMESDSKITENTSASSQISRKDSIQSEKERSSVSGDSQELNEIESATENYGFDTSASSQIFRRDSVQSEKERSSISVDSQRMTETEIQSKTLDSVGSTTEISEVDMTSSTSTSIKGERKESVQLDKNRSSISDDYRKQSLSSEAKKSIDSDEFKRKESISQKEDNVFTDSVPASPLTKQMKSDETDLQSTVKRESVTETIEFKNTQQSTLNEKVPFETESLQFKISESTISDDKKSDEQKSHAASMVSPSFVDEQSGAQTKFIENESTRKYTQSGSDTTSTIRANDEMENNRTTEHRRKPSIDLTGKLISVTAPDSSSLTESKTTITTEYINFGSNVIGSYSHDSEARTSFIESNVQSEEIGSKSSDSEISDAVKKELSVDKSISIDSTDASDSTKQSTTSGNTLLQSDDFSAQRTSESKRESFSKIEASNQLYSTLTESFDDIQVDLQSTKSSNLTSSKLSDAKILNKSESLSSENATNSTKFDTVMSIDEETYFYLEDSDSLAQDGHSMASISEKRVTKENEKDKAILSETSTSLSSTQKHEDFATSASETKQNLFKLLESSSDKTEQPIEASQKSQIEMKDESQTKLIDSSYQFETCADRDGNKNSSNLASDSVKEKIIVKSSDESGSNVMIEERSSINYKPISSFSESSFDSSSVSSKISQTNSEYAKSFKEEERMQSPTLFNQSSTKLTSPTLSPLPGQSFDKLSRDIVDKGVSLRSMAGAELASSIVHLETSVGKVTTNLNLPEVISEEAGSRGEESPDLSSPKQSTNDFIAKVETAPGAATLATTFPTAVEMPSVHLRRSAQMAGQVLYEVPDEEDNIDSPLSEKKQVGLARRTTSSKEFPEVLHISEETTPSTPSETQSPRDVQSSTQTTTVTTSMDITSPQDSKSGLCCFPRSIEMDSTKKGKEEKVTSTSTSETTTRVVTSSQNLTEEQKKEKEATLKEWGTPLGLPKPPDANDSKGARSASKSRATSSDRTGTSRSYSSRRSGSSNDQGKPIYLDLAYIPHHGDRHYCNADYFKRIRARYYVLSSVNPSREVLDALIEGKKSWEDKTAEVTLIPSHETEALCLWMATNQQTLEDLNIDVAPSASRCSVILQDQESSCSAYRVEF